MTFKTWQEASVYAQEKANATRLSLGIEKTMWGEWVVRFIPKKENRYGCDATCEAVEPEMARAAIAKTTGGDNA